MVAAAAPEKSQNSTDSRRKIRVDGQHSLADVARKVCGDVRLLALLCDLNAGVPAKGLLPAGTVVVCPSKTEAAAFARRMGFSIGFNPQAANGTAARRKWAQHVGPGAGRGRVDAEALARSLIAASVTSNEAGRRLSKSCSEAEILALQGSKDTEVQSAARHAEAHLLFPRALSRIAAVRNVLDQTAKPAGLRFLVEALARDAAPVVALLGGCAVAPALREALAAEAPRVAAVLAEGKKLAQLERGARDASATEPALKKVVAALVDGVEPLAGDRVEALGIDAEVEALVRHLEMLRSALKQAEAGLARQPAEIIRAVARGQDGARFARPWPLLCQVVRDVAAAVDAATPAARDRGLGGLAARGTSTEGAPVRLTVADLRVRAAACARAADEGDAFAERLAPVVAELFDLMRPPPAVDGGTPQARVARRRLAFDHAMAAKGAVSAEGIAALAREVVERARLAGHAGAQRLGRTQVQALDEAARQVAGSLSVHRQAMSELGRALVVVAMAVDAVVGQGLSRPTGREAFVAAAMKHAGKVLSAASCAIK